MTAGMTINLEQFCKPEQFQIHGYMRTPFMVNGRTYATNGHILVRVDGYHSITEPRTDIYKRMDEILSALDDSRLSPLPRVEIGDLADCPRCKGRRHMKTCRECDGEGELNIDSDWNTYTVKCLSCRGEGVLPDEDGEPCRSCSGTGKESFKPIQFRNTAIANGYVRILETLPNLLIDLTGQPGDVILFKFDGGVGAVAPIRV